MTSWDDILQAATSAAAGASDAARAALQECWDRTSPSDHAQRCVIAHYLADQQTDLTAETDWDERAVAEHAQVEESDLTALGIDSAAGFAPSLHLNLGDDHLRAGNTGLAREHLVAARNAEHFLSDDGYGAMIRAGIDRLGERLDAATSGSI